MSWLQKKLNALQTRPYEERVRLLRRGIILIAIILIIIWVVTLRFRHLSFGSSNNTGFGDILNNLKKFRNLSNPQ